MVYTRSSEGMLLAATSEGSDQAAPKCYLMRALSCHRCHVA